MEEVTKFLDGFKVITTPYDKVDTSIINKRNIKTVINQLEGGMPLTGGTEQDGKKEGSNKQEGQEGQGEGNNEENNVDGEEEEEEEEAEAEEEEDNRSVSENEKAKNKGPSWLDEQKKKMLEAAQKDADDKGTEAIDGKAIMKKVIKIGTMIIYIMLLPLMPWYYTMKHSFAKLKFLFDGIIKPL